MWTTQPSADRRAVKPTGRPPTSNSQAIRETAVSVFETRHEGQRREVEVEAARSGERLGQVVSVGRGDGRPNLRGGRAGGCDQKQKLKQAGQRPDHESAHRNPVQYRLPRRWRGGSLGG